MIKLMVGLGNPEQKYLNTLHNIGYLTVDCFIKQLEVSHMVNRPTGNVKNLYYCPGKDLFILKPATSMNLSGGPVIKVMYAYNILPEEVLVIYDDIYINYYSSRYRTQGSAGGHNGIKNIIDLLQSEDFTRLKIGVGPISQGMPLTDYVLGTFESQELVTDLTRFNCDLVTKILGGKITGPSTFTKDKT